jgi:hypothetical protein
VYKTQVWYLKMPGEAPAEGENRFGKEYSANIQMNILDVPTRM